MKKYILLFCISVLLNGPITKAQVNLGIVIDSTFGTVPNDTFDLGTSYSLNLWVKNYGPSSYVPATFDSLKIYTAVRDTANFSVLNIVDINLSLLGDSIAAGDSAYATLTGTFIDSTAGYHKDINVIVIWPYTGSASFLDSLEFPIYLVVPDGIGEIDINSIINVFPNPATDHLSIENKSQFAIEEVRIMDISGRLVATLRNPTKIETKTWPAGMYLVNVLFDNKQTRTVRIIKRK